MMFTEKPFLKLVPKISSKKIAPASRINGSYELKKPKSRPSYDIGASK